MAAKKNPASGRSSRSPAKKLPTTAMRKAKGGFSGSGGAGDVSLSEIVVTKRTGGSGIGTGSLV